MKIETRLNENNQTIIPTQYVEKYELNEGDIVEWNENNKGEIIISFKKSDIFSQK